MLSGRFGFSGVPALWLNGYCLSLRPMIMQKNFLPYTALLAGLVLVVLLLLYCLPRIEWGGHQLRQVDLLGDVRPLPSVPADSLLPDLPPVRPAFVDSCPEGMTCIEDYGDSTGCGMTGFYRALDEVGWRPVRIAYFGDSFIEGDILTADLRALLQERFGGCGVGYVDITSRVTFFRPTVSHTFSGWESHAWTDSTGFDRQQQGLSGHYFRARRGAYVELCGRSDYASHLDTCSRASFFFAGGEREVQLSVRLNGEKTRRRVFPSSDRLQMAVVEGTMGRVRWTVEQADESAVFYGLCLDDVRGISLDNLSLRGSSGLSIRTIPESTLCAFGELRPYDLIVLQYGLNVATEYGRDYNRYVAGMHTVIERLKRAFPQASVLLVGVGDRDHRDENGRLCTMPGIKNLLRYQQRLAADEKIAFWNLFEAMGGEGSMARLAEAEPSLANRDYAHINFRGGKYLARLLYEALMHGKEQSDKRRAYELE